MMRGTVTTGNTVNTGKKRILLISSSGGHWVQMNRIVPAFKNHDLYFCSTDFDYMSLVPEGRFYCVPDGSRNSNPFHIVHLALAVLRTLLQIKPHVIVTTGAAPGFFALFIGKLLGMKTVWIDSIANVNELSMSGRKAAWFADLYITQWPHLAQENGPYYYGSVV